MPRSFTDNPKKFGRSSKRLTAKPIESPHQAAAELQHAIATRIREHLLDKNTTLTAFCQMKQLPRGLTNERFERILRGETMLALTDLMFWASEIPDLATTVAAKVTEFQVEEASETPVRSELNKRP